jgi:hypothetical protein
MKIGTSSHWGLNPKLGSELPAFNFLGYWLGLFYYLCNKVYLSIMIE